MTFAVLEGERRDPLASYAEGGADIWSPKHTLVAPATVEAAHKAGLKVIPWTVNDTEDMRRLIELGVDGIITDRPDLLVDLR